MTHEEIRHIIREHSEAKGSSYRITQDGEVHYHGRMPNSIETGWYLVAQSAGALALEIARGER